MSWSHWSPQMRSVLRIIASLLFIEHGLMKLFHFPGPLPGVSDPLPLMYIAAAVFELVGGSLIAIGLFTRVAAFVCSGEMAVGYFLIHAPHGFWPGLNQGEAAILFCFIFLYISLAGPGPWSIDARMPWRGSAIN